MLGKQQQKFVIIRGKVAEVNVLLVGLELPHVRRRKAK